MWIGFPILILLALVGCDSGFFVDPPEQGTVSLELRIPPIPSAPVQGETPPATAAAVSAAAATAADLPAAAGAARAFGRVDQVSVRVTSEGQTLLDEVVPAQPSSGEITLTFQFDLDQVRADAQIEVELRAGQQGLFGGEGSAELERGRTAQAEVGLAPIPSGIRIPPPPEPLESLGDTLILVGAVVFATGDTIPGLEVEWSSGAPEVVSVTPQGVAVALAEGEAELQASFADFLETLTVRVAPVVVEVEVTPAAVEADPGATVQFTAETRDRRGNVLPGRDVEWSTTDERVATVDSQGRVATLRPGEVEVVAVSEEGEGRADLVVRQVPPTLTTRPAEGVEADRATLVGEVNPRGSTTEVRFRWGTSSTLQGAALTEPIDVSDGLIPVRVEAELEDLQPFTTYFFRIEASTNAGVFSGTIQSFTTLNPVPAPTALLASFTQGAVSLSWTFDAGAFPGVVYEVERRVEDPEEGVGEWEVVGVSQETRFTDLDVVPASILAYRVRACVDDVCSPPSDMVEVEIPDAEPARIEGVVRLDGEPVSGMPVRLTGGGMDPRTTLTLVGGGYAFDGVEGGGYAVEIVPSTLDFPDQWFPGRRVEITVFGFGETLTVDFDGNSPPLPPEGLTLFWFGEMRVSWTPPAGGPRPDRYEVERAVVASGGPGAFTSVGSTASTSLGDDAPGGEFWAYRVRSCLSGVCSEPLAPDSTWSPVTAIYGVATGEDGQPAQEAVSIQFFRYPEGGPNGSGEFDSTTPGGGFGLPELPPGHYKYTDRFGFSILPGPGESAYFEVSGFDDINGTGAVVDSVLVTHGERVRVELNFSSETPQSMAAPTGTAPVPARREGAEARESVAPVRPGDRQPPGLEDGLPPRR